MKEKSYSYQNLLVLLFLMPILAINGCAGINKTEKSLVKPELTFPLPASPSPEMEELLITQTEPEKVISFPEKGDELISLSLRDAEIKEVLLALAKKSDFNIIVDPDVSGTVTVDLKKVALNEVLESLLIPLNLEFHQKGKFIRIYKPRLETRVFTLNYVAIKRKGTSSLTVSGGVAEAGEENDGGGGSGGGSEEESETAIETETTSDLWKDIQNGLETIVFGDSKEQDTEAGAAWSRGDESGRVVVANPMSGIILIKTHPSMMEKVALFLERIEGSIQREVLIQTKIVEVALSNQYQLGIDWKALGKIGELQGNIEGEWVFGQTLSPETGAFQMGVISGDFSALLDAMANQGNLNMLSCPRICTLNNQKATIKVGREEVYWEVETERSEEYGWVVEGAESRTITVGIILDVTPQIHSNGFLTMHIHPSISEVVGQSVSRFGDTRPVLDIREADTMVRVKDGQTIVIGGMMKDKKVEQLTKTPFLGDIPYLGKLFRYTGQEIEKTELAIFLTPTILWGKRIETLSQRELKKLEAMERKFHLGDHPWKYGTGGELFR